MLPKVGRIVGITMGLVKGKIRIAKKTLQRIAASDGVCESATYKLSPEGTAENAQDASPVIANGLTTLCENSQSSQDSQPSPRDSVNGRT